MEVVLIKTLYEDEYNILNHNLIINSRNQNFTQFLLTTKDVNISVEIDREDLRNTIIDLEASWEDWKEFNNLNNSTKNIAEIGGRRNKVKDYMIKVSMEVQVCDEESFESAKAWVQENILDNVNYEFEIEEV